MRPYFPGSLRSLARACELWWSPCSCCDRAALTTAIVTRVRQARQQYAGVASGLRLHHIVRGAGERAGGWWWNRGDMTVRELDRMKSRELNNGRLAMCAAGPLHSPRYRA